MSWMRRVTELFARITDMVRRFVPTSTADPTRWQVEGFVDGDETERDDLDVFQGIGFASRPPDGAAAECVAVAVNARDHHVIVATRDASTTQAVIAEVQLEMDETVVFTSNSIVKITADGEVMLGRIGGDFKRVALEGHTHPLPALSGTTTYSTVQDPTAKTFGPDSISDDTKVT